MVIAGWRKNFEVLADAGERPCLNCHHTTRHFLVGERKEVRLYFVPVAKFGRKRHLVCEVCSHTSQVSDGEASQIVLGSINPVPSESAPDMTSPSQPQGGGNGSARPGLSEDGFRSLLAMATNDAALEQELTQKYAADVSLYFETVAAAAGEMAQRLVGEESGPKAMATELRRFAEGSHEAKEAVEYVIAVHTGDTVRAGELLAATAAPTVVLLAVAINVALAAKESAQAKREVTPVDMLNFHYVIAKAERLLASQENEGTLR